MIWVDLARGVNDLEFSQALTAYLNHLKAHSVLEDWKLTRRKLGFGPDVLGEWNVMMSFKNLQQLDEAFLEVAPRAGETEQLHAAVFSKVVNFKAGLYRDFPDVVRKN